MKLSLAFVLSCFLTLQSETPRSSYRGGHLVGDEGHRFFLDCYGTGSPTILLWSGQGGGFLDWLLVQPSLAKTNRVCSFDPAGFGRSDSTPDADTFEGNVRALSTALDEAREHGPFVVVGQSYGGIDARLFQLEHPASVHGIVLIDSYEIAAPWKGHMVPLYDLTAEQLRSVLPNHAHAPRPVPPTEIEPPFKKLPLPAQQEHLADVKEMISALDFSKEPSIMESYRSTLLELHDNADSPNSLHGLPLFIITRDGVSPPEEAIQESYRSLSSQSRRQVAKGSGHYVQLDDPAIVLSAIHVVIAEAAQRSSVPHSATR